MTRIYENHGFWMRNVVSLGILIAVAIYGLWELWAAYNSTEDATMGFLFGAGFLGGAAYGAWQLINDNADLVAAMDLDEATGDSVVSLWRPFWTEKLKRPAGDIRNWRFYVKVGARQMRTFYIYADHPSYPRTLQFDLRKANLDGLRKVAPEAVAEFEAALGADVAKYS